MANIKDVAKAAGVAPITVSRIINGHKVSEDKRQAVLAAIKKLNYRPNLVARNLRTNSSKVVGLIISDIGNSFFAQIAKGAGAILEKQGFSLLIANTNQDIEQQEKALNNMLSRQVEGIILCSASSKVGLREEIYKSGCPVVVVDNKLAEMEDLDLVVGDNIQAGYDLTEHFCMMGYKRIAMVSGPLDQTSASERVEGYKKALQDYGLEVRGELIFNSDFTYLGGEEKANKLLNLQPVPEVILAGNNHMAIGVIKAIKAAGLSIPEQIAVGAFEDTEAGELTDPPLTTIIQPAYEMGENAARILLYRLNFGEQGPVQRKILPAKLVIRKSCGFYLKDPHAAVREPFPKK